MIASCIQGSRLGLAAVALQHLERFHESNDLFRRATKKDPNDLDTWIAWGNLFLEKNHLAEAASVFSDVLKVNPNHPEALMGSALSRREADGAQVQGILKKVLEINPNLSALHVFLAGTALDAEDYNESADEIERCLKVNSRSLKALSLKATLYYAKGQYTESEKQIQEVLSINPQLRGCLRWSG